MDLKYKPRKKKDDSDSETEDFDSNSEQVDENGLGNVERPLVWCSEIDLFMNYLMSERGYNPNELDLKIGIDFGQESLKVRNSEAKIK